MSFAKAIKKEFRDTFGPQWVSSAVSYTVIIAGLLMVAYIGNSMLGFAEDNITDVLNNIKIEKE